MLVIRSPLAHDRLRPIKLARTDVIAPRRYCHSKYNLRIDRTRRVPVASDTPPTGTADANQIGVLRHHSRLGPQN